MKKCAIIIGVNKTGGLQTLTGAVSGARDFAAWANPGSSFGYKALIGNHSPPLNHAAAK